MAIYNKDGTAIKCIKAVAHRGYSTTAPENTIPAYVLAAQNGFKYVECDVSFTSDGVPMLLHDSTIDRTSNGSGTLSQMTYDQVRQYDFGSWKSEAYTGTVIPTLSEFLDCCVTYSLHPYIELKDNGNYTQAQIQGIVDLVETKGLKGKVTYISFSAVYLGYVKNYDADARLGYVTSSVSDSTYTTVQGLRTDSNHVFLDSKVYGSSVIDSCKNINLPLEIWTLTDISSATSINAYITGATANGGDPSGLDNYQGTFGSDGDSVDSAFNISGLLN